MQLRACPTGTDCAAAAATARALQCELWQLKQPRGPRRCMQSQAPASAEAESSLMLQLCPWQIQSASQQGPCEGWVCWWVCFCAAEGVLLMPASLPAVIPALSRLLHDSTYPLVHSGVCSRPHVGPERYWQGRTGEQVLRQPLSEGPGRGKQVCCAGACRPRREGERCTRVLLLGPQAGASQALRRPQAPGSAFYLYSS